MKYLALTVSVFAILFLSVGATPSQPPKRVYHVNADFFLANNDDVMEALSSYAEAICIQDKVIDNSPEAWLLASSKCADSYRDDQGEVTSDDGGWKEFSLVAYREIVAMCVGRVDELCRWFR